MIKLRNTCLKKSNNIYRASTALYPLIHYQSEYVHKVTTSTLVNLNFRRLQFWIRYQLQRLNIWNIYVYIYIYIPYILHWRCKRKQNKLKNKWKKNTGHKIFTLKEYISHWCLQEEKRKNERRIQVYKSIYKKRKYKSMQIIVLKSPLLYAALHSSDN